MSLDLLECLDENIKLCTQMSHNIIDIEPRKEMFKMNRFYVRVNDLILEYLDLRQDELKERRYLQGLQFVQESSPTIPSPGTGAVEKTEADIETVSASISPQNPGEGKKKVISVDLSDTPKIRR